MKTLQMFDCIPALLSAALLVASAASCAAPEPEGPPRFPDAVRKVRPPARPAHRTWFVDEPLPEGADTQFRDQMNKWVKHFIDHADDVKEDRFCKELWQFFGMYAVWGLSSPDSEWRDNETLAALLNQWLDEKYPKPPDDPEKRKTWLPEEAVAGDWTDWYVYAPWIEITARPKLREIVGPEREEKWIKVLLDRSRLAAGKKWPSREKHAFGIVNFTAHTFAPYTAGWVLAVERDKELADDLFRKAAYLVHMLGWHMHPNGSIRYIHRLGNYDPEFQGEELVAESMYYHNINLRSLYAFWWFTGDEAALALLKKQAPYYKLRVMPWGATEYHSAIWWKDLWRTFWPSGAALSAAATEDGELVRVALDMAEGKHGWDRKYRDWGEHGYKQIALKGLKPEPRRDNYLIEDPDIGGLRGRFGEFAFTFSSVSHGRTLAGILTPGGGLVAAGPMVRLDPLKFNPKWDFNNLDVAGRRKPRALVTLEGRCAAAAATFAPHPQKTTWRDHRPGPWKFQQLWLYLPDRLVGLTLATPTEETEGRSVEHFYRFFGDSLAQGEDADMFDTADLRVRVVKTNLPHHLIEPARGYCMVLRERNRQLVLSDVERIPAPEAREKPDDDPAQLALRPYKPGQVFWSLVEIARKDAPPGRWELAWAEASALAFRGEVGKSSYEVGVNFGDEAVQIPGWKDAALPGMITLLAVGPD